MEVKEDWNRLFTGILQNIFFHIPQKKVSFVMT